MRRIQNNEVRSWGALEGIRVPITIGTYCPYCGEKVILSLGNGLLDAKRRAANFSATCAACPAVISFFCLYDSNNKTSDVYVNPPGGGRREPKEFDESVPEPLKRSYMSTVRSLSDRNYVATAVGSRRTLEGIFKYPLPNEHQNLPLAKAIDKVKETRDLSKPLSTLSHAIRQGGNLGAHFDPEREPTAEQAEQMVDLLEYRTQRPENALVDIATEHRPIQKGLINWDAYRQTLASWVYPHLDGLTPLWFPADPAVDSGVFLLMIPPQPDRAKYFVVREMDRPDGTFPGAFGVPIRQGDVVSWLRPEAVQGLISEALGVRRGGLALPVALERAQLVQSEQDRVVSRCAQIEARSGWADMPFVAFHAIPSHPIPRPDDFYAEGGFRTILERPGVLRRAGFHIRTEAGVDVQPDGSLATATRRRALWLSPDGLFSAAGSANADFLGWYFNSDNQRPVTLNPRVLTEFALEFSRFFHSQLRPLHTGSWSIWVSVVGLDRDGGVVLVPMIGRGGEVAQFWRDMHWEQRVPLRPTEHVRVESTGAAGADAYRLLVELYALFGAPPNDIPFVENAHVSEQRLLAAMGQ
jgi:uncharacterized protein DUF4145